SPHPGQLPQTQHGGTYRYRGAKAGSSSVSGRCQESFGIAHFEPLPPRTIPSFQAQTFPLHATNSTEAKTDRQPDKSPSAGAKRLEPAPSYPIPFHPQESPLARSGSRTGAMKRPLSGKDAKRFPASQILLARMAPIDVVTASNCPIPGFDGLLLRSTLQKLSLDRQLDFLEFDSSQDATEPVRSP